MNYKQLTEKNKVEIDILLKQGLSMRQVAKSLGISHSTVSRYKAGIYRKRKISIPDRYPIFIDYLYTHYDRRVNSIELCVHTFKKQYKYAKSPSIQQVYNWVKEGKINLTRQSLCYKKTRSRKRNNSMINHTLWNLKNKTVLPISLRPKHIDDRKEIGHLEIDSIVGKKNEQESIISIVDRCTRKLWLIKAEYKQPFYINKIVYEYIIKNEITVRSITVDNGLEFEALGIVAKKLKVKLYKCDPYCSFQRGTNERMNAMVRRFIPKGSSMKLKPQIYLDDICFMINSMPRKIFDYKSSYDVESDYE